MKKEKLYNELRERVYKIIYPNSLNHPLLFSLQDIFIAIAEIHEEKDNPAIMFSPYKGVRLYDKNGNQTAFYDIYSNIKDQSTETLQALINLIT